VERRFPRARSAISRGVEPHPHHSIRRGIVEDLLGALPIRIRLSDSPWRRKMRLRTKQTTSTTRTMAQTSPISYLRRLAEGNHRAVGDDFGQGIADLGRVETHRDDPFAADELAFSIIRSSA